MGGILGAPGCCCKKKGGDLTIAYTKCGLNPLEPDPYPGLAVKVYAAAPDVTGRYARGALVATGVTDASGVVVPAGVPAGHYWVEPDITADFWPAIGTVLVPTGGTATLTRTGTPRPHWTCTSCCDALPGPELSDTMLIEGGGGSWTATRTSSDNLWSPSDCMVLPLIAGFGCACDESECTMTEATVRASFACAPGTSEPISIQFHVPLCPPGGTGGVGGFVPLRGGEFACDAPEFGGLDDGHAGSGSALPGGSCVGGSFSQTYRMATAPHTGINHAHAGQFWANPTDFTATEGSPSEMGRSVAVTGKVWSNNFTVGVAGATVAIIDYDDGTTYATFTANGSGNYSGDVAIPVRRARVYVHATSGDMEGDSAPTFIGDGTVGNTGDVSVGYRMTVTVTVLRCEGGVHAGLAVRALGPLSVLSPPFDRASGVTDASGQVTLSVWADADFTLSCAAIAGRRALSTVIPKGAAPVSHTFTSYPTTPANRPVRLTIRRSDTDALVSGVSVIANGVTRGTTNASGFVQWNQAWQDTDLTGTWSIFQPGVYVTQSWSQTIPFNPCNPVTSTYLVTRTIVPV